MIRRVTVEDIPWLHQLCAEAYRKGHYDPVASEAWVRSMIPDPNHFVLRGRGSWMAVTVAGFPWAPKQKWGRFEAVAGKASKEMFRMAEISVRWMQEMGAKGWYMATVNDVDFGPIARYLLGKPATPAYTREFSIG